MLSLGGSTNGAAVHVFSDLDCSQGERVPQLSECLTGDEQYRSYELRCVR